MPEAQVREVLSQVQLDFSDRHRNLPRILERHFDLVAHCVPDAYSLTACQRELIGAYVTMEYAYSSAALFNPSIVPHPDQTGLDSRDLRFVLSLRAVGEGHISSIEFRSGVIGANGNVLFDPVSDYVETPVRQANPIYDRGLFTLKLEDMNVDQNIAQTLMERLPARFDYRTLQIELNGLCHQLDYEPAVVNRTFSAVNWLANSNYELDFDPGRPISERVLFSTSELERSGVEDARFVQFHGDGGDCTYYATYTAYDGANLLPQLIETRDFVHFKMFTLSGRGVQNKGMALFPRKVHGKYVMLSRQDGENNYLMVSDNLHVWKSYSTLQVPAEPWEFVQLGNCGSPLETRRGWLVITHGVGPMREYSIGAILLDRDEPSRVIARLRRPLLRPHQEEREGYVPNVVYSCGSLIHQGELIMPYAMSDISSGMVSVNVDELIDCMDPI
ncbi:glycoside hydrolase family 130 protein [Marinimicrobium sp. C6131]|uniref:glycoside hydrolase family 130 protein n=1 Tax=Marinimicrobium sp. C6131 TaxID=3022676 RepID=UPI00223D513D|nr:glycoside hydrolase family 130 protein [Marinimicrobium sp. C6131]UZJ45277.1 glycoside hydrolase family 130 protein [Marinimicrobium sp. C6131]